MDNHKFSIHHVSCVPIANRSAAGRAILLCTAFALSACVTTQGGNYSTNNALGAKTNKVGVEDTPLNNIFAKTASAPVNISGNTPAKDDAFRAILNNKSLSPSARSQALRDLEKRSNGVGANAPDRIPYPRVALRVISWEGGVVDTAYQRTMPNGCLNFSAVIWESSTKSQKVPNFSVCTQDVWGAKSTQYAGKAWTLPGGTGPDQYTIHSVPPFTWGMWTSNQGVDLAVSANTGHQRTDGPLPPLYTMDVAQKDSPEWRLIGGGRNEGALAPFLQIALHKMGYRVENNPDGRLWIVSSTIRAMTRAGY